MTYLNASLSAGLLAIALLSTAFVLPEASQAQGAGTVIPRVPRYFQEYDLNHDGRIDREEWKRRGNFERLDTNKNGYLELFEFRVIYFEAARLGPLTAPILPAAAPEMDPTVEADRMAFVGGDKLCAVNRTRRCDGGIAVKHGLFETGLGPVFPKGAHCHGIDEFFAMDYADKGAESHGGIDLPADFGTPMLAAAAGTVVAKSMGERTARGIEIVLRHSPADTGLPMWTYTQYAHMNALPTQVVGQRVRMGEVLGPTGNSGTSMSNRNQKETNRRPGIHFAVWFTDSRRYALSGDIVVPEDLRWMDPNALYRKTPPFDSYAMKALPEAEKFVPISIMFTDGTTQPANTKLIWPYACAHD